MIFGLVRTEPTKKKKERGKIKRREKGEEERCNQYFVYNSYALFICVVYLETTDRC